MFENAESFSQDISNWKINIEELRKARDMFEGSSVKEEYKPKLK